LLFKKKIITADCIMVVFDNSNACGKSIEKIELIPVHLSIKSLAEECVFVKNCGWVPYNGGL